MRKSIRPLPWLLLLPFFLAWAAFWAIPLAQGFLISLQSDVLFGDPEFIGFAHYRELVHDARFLHALRNTFFYASISIPLTTVFSLGLALLLRRAYVHFQGTLLFCLMLPGLTPPAVLAFLYLLVFNGPHGLLNAIFLTPLGLSPLDWLRDPGVIKVALMLQTLWRWSGFTTLILLAGMDGIPKTYWHICQAEGASAWQTLRRVTLPLLSPLLLFISAYLFLDAFVLFEGSYILLGGSGGTLDAGLLLVSYNYYTAFTLGHFASAAAMAFAVVPLLMTLIALLILPGWQKRKRIKHGEGQG